jgi:hypothetical protein
MLACAAIAGFEAAFLIEIKTCSDHTFIVSIVACVCIVR